MFVYRDDQFGFGLTLSGDRPVSVQTVRPGGAADRAGIQQQDVIVKVNGTHVTQSTHGEVVELIAGRTTFILGLGRVYFPRIPIPEYSGTGNSRNSSRDSQNY